MKRLFVFTFALAAIAPAYGCIDGEKKQMDCHTCICYGDTWNCTHESCDNSNKSKGLTPIINTTEGSNTYYNYLEPQELPCTPGHLYNDYCNVCKCSDDGKSYSCTEMACDKSVFNKDGTFKFLKKRRLARQVPRQFCRPGSTFKDDCNGCICSDDGTTADCTQMSCSTTVRDKREALRKPCTPNQQFKDNCNSCLCGDDGKTLICSDLNCDKNISDEDRTLRIESKDLESTIKNTIQNKTCEPGSLKSEDGICNFCVCNKKGTDQACTKYRCSSDLIRAFEKEEIMAQMVTLYKDGDTCLPNKGYYNDCNKCVCRDDGSYAYCTLMKCDNT